MQRKRFCTLLLVACFVVGMLVFPVSAAVDSGTYSDNIKWEFDTATGTLTISGTGTAQKGSAESYTKYQLDIRHLVIADGITSIGRFAFSHIGLLESIWIADSVKTIEEGAFANNFHVTKLHLGNGVTDIGEAAFMTFSKLETLILPSSVRSIGLEAFSLCGMKSLIIPEGVAVIENSAFRASENLTRIFIPESVTHIKNGAFRDCLSLKDVYYAGTQAQWEAITIDHSDEIVGDATTGGNTMLLAATVHYNHTHTWDDGKVTVAATCKKDGEKIFTCTECEMFSSQSISSPHTWDGGTKNADTTVTYTCAACHTTKTEGTPVVTPPVGQENTATEETTSQTDGGTTATENTGTSATETTETTAPENTGTPATESTETTVPETNSSPTEPEDTGRSGGYVWAVLITAVLLIGGGAAAWFLLRKKK